jgi:predicted SAM-dependent methyltransferase
MPPEARLRLNLGCGHVTPEGWINVDGSNRAWLASRWPAVDRLLTASRLIPPSEFTGAAVYANLTRDFPWPEGSASAVYMGEVLEHFRPTDGEALLRRCYKVLGPGGILRLRVPDNARFWRNYLDEYTAIRSRPRREWNTHHSRWVEWFFRDICVEPPGRFSAESFGHYHKWMYDDVSLINLFETVGFREVERMPFHQSRIPEIKPVEARDDLIVEGVK